MKKKVMVFLFFCLLSLSWNLDEHGSLYGQAEVKLKSSNVKRFSKNNKNGYPKINRYEITLVPDQKKKAAGVIFLKSKMGVPFEINFDYSIYGDDGGDPWASADGLVFMFCKNSSAYETQKPPTGGNRGFIEDGTGYGVHFAIYGWNRGILLKDGYGDLLKSAFFDRNSARRDIYTHGEWRHVKITVHESSIVVFYEGKPVLRWDYKIDTEHKGIGFGAATGAADGEHKIRNVTVKPVRSESTKK